MARTVTEMIGGKGYANDAASANDVWCNGVEVCLDGIVAQTSDDLWEEVGNAEERHTNAEADNHVERPKAILHEDAHGLTE